MSNDLWGYPLDGRTYQSDPPRRADYKFTGKQRDTETGWDYFGARYYDARIANWGSVEPLLKNRISWSPYNYARRNPILNVDIDGRIDVPEEYKSQYPKLYNYLEKCFEKNVINDKKMLDAFKVTGMSEDKIKENLKFGKGPIKLEIIDLGYNDSRQKRLGHWNAETQTIQIDPLYVKKLEESKGDALEVYSFLVQALILHEAAHAAQDLSGNSNSSDEDIGYIYEDNAFNRHIDSYNKAARTMNWRNYDSHKAKRYEEKKDGN